MSQDIKMVPINSIAPHPKNPNKNDISRIEASIGKRGFYGLVIVQQSTMFILAGEHRWRALLRRNNTKVRVGIIDVDDETAIEILLSDNKLNHLGKLDAAISVDIIQELCGPSPDNDELFDLGYSEISYQLLLDALDDTPSIEPPPIEDEKYKVTISCSTLDLQLMVADIAEEHELPYKLTPRPID